MKFAIVTKTHKGAVNYSHEHNRYYLDEKYAYAFESENKAKFVLNDLQERWRMKLEIVEC